MSNFQRDGAISNTEVGIVFEAIVARVLREAGLIVHAKFPHNIGVANLKKEHIFDFGSESPATLVECKSHRWTKPGDNSPSAKLTVWNESMYYFSLSPPEFRRIFVVARDLSTRRGVTLGNYYLSRYRHLVPNGVEFWELDEGTEKYEVLFTGA